MSHFAWRALVMPFETLLILAMLVAGALAFLLIAAWFALRRRRVAVDKPMTELRNGNR